MTIKHQVKKKEEFKADFFRTINISKKNSIKAVIGVLKGETKTCVREFVFDDENATQEDVKTWIEKNSHKLRSFNVEDSLDCKALSVLDGDDYDTETTRIFKEFSTFNVKAVEDEEKKLKSIRIAGYLSTFKNMDRCGDVVSEKAFDETIKDIKKNRGGIFPMLKDHWSMVDMQAGSWDVFKVDKIGLYVEGEIPRTPLNEQHLIGLIEGGHINTLSMGGMFVFEDKKGKRFIVKVNLLEGSIVTIPANAKAQFSKKSLFDHELKPELVADEVKAKGVSKDDRLKSLNEFIKTRR